MTHAEEQLLADIQALARAIRRDTELPVSYDELMHRPEAGCAIDCRVHISAGGPMKTSWQGSSRPLRCQVTLEEMRDAMGRWLVEYRQQQEKVA